MNPEIVLKLVKDKAIAKWGEDYWFAQLVRGYTEAENNATGKKLKPLQRRSQIEKLFNDMANQDRLALKTAAYLLKAVGGEIEIVFVSRETAKLSV